MSARSCTSRQTGPAGTARRRTGGWSLDWQYEADDGVTIGLEVIRAVDQDTERDIWGRVKKLFGSTAIAPDKATTAITKKSRLIDRYRETLASVSDNRPTEMHLAVVDPWGGELFIPAFMPDMKAIANASPFDQVWFVDLRHAAYPTAESLDRVREIDSDVAGMSISERAFVSIGYLPGYRRCYLGTHRCRSIDNPKTRRSRDRESGRL